ncbi:MAG TPA: pyridoxamine 5'-phosphate oxidase family protein [Verrucomicrobiae bacterium]|jgi:hypothetical protein|nr:pyridoxamine 5'-phosphate oxidase family protein [Verrucomicrobiae bacterium]
MEPAHPSRPIAHALTPGQRAFLDAPLFATVATTDQNGAARQAVIWYRREDDDRILINSRRTRFWPANLQRDGRVSLAVIGRDGYSWLGLTGHVAEVDDDPERALADIVALAWRYHPDGPAAADLDSYAAYPRITFRIAIDGVHDHLED